MKKSKISVKTLAGLAMLTALVVILQLMGNIIRIGPMGVSLVLVPIIIGAAIYGPWGGMWLGGVFGLVVLLAPETAGFMGINAFGTIVTIMLRGLIAGFVTGLAYKLLRKWNLTVAAIAAGIICPVLNTGIFALGMWVFFWNTVSQLAGGAGSAVAYLFLTMIGANFLLELGINMVLTPVIVRLTELGRKSSGNKAA